MLTILKGILVLPIAVLIVGGVLVVGSIAVSIVGALIAILCVLVPFVLKAAAVVFAVGLVLWILGSFATEIVRCACNR